MRIFADTYSGVSTTNPKIMHIRYGGIHLGPDRFKHINNAARELLVQCGATKMQNEGTGAGAGVGKQRGRRKRGSGGGGS